MWFASVLFGDNNERGTGWGIGLYSSVRREPKNLIAVSKLAGKCKYGVNMQFD